MTKHRDRLAHRTTERGRRVPAGREARRRRDSDPGGGGRRGGNRCRFWVWAGEREEQRLREQQRERQQRERQQRERQQREREQQQREQQQREQQQRELGQREQRAEARRVAALGRLFRGGSARRRARVRRSVGRARTGGHPPRRFALCSRRAVRSSGNRPLPSSGAARNPRGSTSASDCSLLVASLTAREAMGPRTQGRGLSELTKVQASPLAGLRGTSFSRIWRTSQARNANRVD
jgi:hypothetical protein